MATTDTPNSPVYPVMTLPPRRKLARNAALAWLREGYRYMGRARGVSMAYGTVFAAIGMLITWLGFNRPQFVLTFWTGFLLVGPLFAMGLYRIAQLQDRGETIRFSACMGALRKRLGSVALFSLLLSLVMIAWIRFSTLAAALYIGNIAGSSGFIAALASPEGIGFLAVLFGVGAVFAALMFALTAWSLPMVLDARVDFGTAVVTSVKAAIEQPLPMLTWGAAVAGLTIIGMLTFFLAFVVIFPWLGYATWAGYKDLFARD
ncbi:MAG: DUF2189 domain-containing protein [Chromatiaceae bacterium]|mgnify:CR=1 FL=1|nr:DUF2189 domain-containing protein [Gammaproteobacteria bacterium]MCP5318971.1 DUF2189 domain-containing protein [Chromatiaceae bacterium]MCW5587798.1 DUF2189 domain-containing protein [Chromatiales bacterium]HPQ25272.1 DUF2189 domain-containing protein [Gammaproteobacteria bacterium]